MDKGFYISIHAPIVGCDEGYVASMYKKYDFNPRTHRGVRPIKMIHYQSILIFQSTHPSWGATFTDAKTLTHFSYFNPRTHRGVRQDSVLTGHFTEKFQSTHPSWGATSFGWSLTLISIISIHAPIVGCDLFHYHLIAVFQSYFNPRTHRGVRRLCSCRCTCIWRFQSTHPSWGATYISCCSISWFILFQSTHPSWGATVAPVMFEYVVSCISIHAPIVGCDF